MPSDLQTVAKLANEEFVARSGVRFFEVPLRQLFDYDHKRTLVVHPDADLNRRALAKMALDFQGCAGGGGVSLRQSLMLGKDGQSSLVYAAGSKLLCAVDVRAPSSPVMTAFAVVANLKPNVLEPAVLRAMTHRGMDDLLTQANKGVYLELVCALPHTGGATYLMLRLLGKLARTNSLVLAHAVNAKSGQLFRRHHYEEVPMGKTDRIFLLSRERAQAHAAEYLAMLRTRETMETLCWRRGASPRTRDRTYWDCR